MSPNYHVFSHDKYPVLVFLQNKSAVYKSVSEWVNNRGRNIEGG